MKPQCSPGRTLAGSQHITGTNRIHLVLFGMQNMIFDPYLAGIKIGSSFQADTRRSSMAGLKLAGNKAGVAPIFLVWGGGVFRSLSISQEMLASRVCWPQGWPLAKGWQKAMLASRVTQSGDAGQDLPAHPSTEPILSVHPSVHVHALFACGTHLRSCAQACTQRPIRHFCLSVCLSVCLSSALSLACEELLMSVCLSVYSCEPGTRGAADVCLSAFLQL
jgi:hypothetical protein